MKSCAWCGTSFRMQVDYAMYLSASRSPGLCKWATSFAIALLIFFVQVVALSRASPIHFNMTYLEVATHHKIIACTQWCHTWLLTSHSAALGERRSLRTRLKIKTSQTCHTLVDKVIGMTKMMGNRTIIRMTTTCCWTWICQKIVFDALVWFI